MSLKPEERLFFIHIPKTAGTSLIPVIDMNFPEHDICPAQLWRDLVHLPQADLPQYRLFRGHFGGGGLDSFLPEAPVYMTMLREPIPLSLSTYKFIYREPGTRVHQLVRKNTMTFSDFLAHPKTCGKISNKQTRHLSFDLKHDPDSGPIFLNRESREVVDRWVRSHKQRLKPKERLERAQQKLLECRFFGLVERFEESMLLMCHSFGWSPTGRVQKLMVAPKKRDSENELSNEDRDRVVSLNTLDLALYEFAAREFDRRLAAMHHDLEQFAESPDRSRTQPIRPRQARDSDFTSKEFADTYQRLDRRYLARRAAAEEPKRDRIRVSFGDALAGDGWHRREASALDGSTFRWTGPGEVSTIDLAFSANEDVRLSLCIINVPDESLIDDMRIFANNSEIDIEQVTSPACGRVFQGDIPAASLNYTKGLLRLSIEVPHCVRPCDCESHSTDTRAVGLAINWIDLTPISRLGTTDVHVENVSPDELLRRRERKKEVVSRGVKQRVAQLPVIGPKLKAAYIRLKNR